MHPSSSGSEDREGVIRVVPEANQIVVVCLEGDFDRTNVPALCDQIDGALGTANDLIVDLSEATFIDASVIHVLERVSETAKDRGQGVVLQVGTAAIVERVLELTAIDRVLPRADDRHEAVRILRVGRSPSRATA